MENRQQEFFVQKHLKRNMTMSTVDGAFFAFGAGMAPLATTLTYFISQYVESTTIIGLLATMSAFLINLPQVFMARYIEAKPNNLRILKVIALLQRIIWFLLATTIFLIKSPFWMILSIYVLYSAYSFVTGLTAVTWFDLMAKVIPPSIRGRFFGFRTALSSGAEFLGALLAAYILGKFAFPHSYGVLFMLVGVFTMVSYGFLLYMKEEDWVRQTEKEPLMNYIKKLGKILKEDKTFFYFMCALGIAILGSAGANFRIVYAKNVLGITARDVQVLTSVWIFSRAISSIGWGFVNDWKGYRFTMIAAHVIFFPSYILMNYLTGFGMLCIIFILHGIAESAIWVTQGNFIIQLGGEKNRATYLGLSSILFTPISAIGPLLMGGIIDLVNYQAAFLLSGVLMLVMVVITYKKVHVAKVI